MTEETEESKQPPAPPSPPPVRLIKENTTEHQDKSDS
jgi:hypothetical protein